MTMQSFHDRVAEAILSEYDHLPMKYKPACCNAGIRNWVPLSGLALVDELNEQVEVVAIATGMKCLPAIAISSLQGLALHDSHAEVLAIRLFNHFLLNECNKIASSPSTSPFESAYVRSRASEEQASSQCPQHFAIRENWQIWMYCSEAPCGDSSMELIMAKQDDATPWSASVASADSDPPGFAGLKGRGNFDELGTVRRKPARADSPPTLSKSCSDKIAMKQCSSLLSSLMSLLILPSSAYLHTLLLPESQYIPEACERAFGPTGRMKPVAKASWGFDLAYRPFSIKTTACEFRYSRRASESLEQGATPESKPSNLTTIWNPHTTQLIINGIVQGRRKRDPRGASAISRKSMIEYLMSTVQLFESLELKESLQGSRSYLDVKACLKSLGPRREMKAEVTRAALQGWLVNERDDFIIQ